MVEWRKIPSFPDYEASADGQVRRRRPGERQLVVLPLAMRAERNGYLKVALWVDDVGRTLWAHRLVCEAFHGLPPTPKHTVAHWNGIRGDNRASNLRWATREENSADMVRHGTAWWLKKKRRALGC